MGCGHDLLSKFDMEMLQATPCKVPVFSFDTAGGVVTSDRGARLWVDELDAEITLRVLDTSTPAVMSVGARCMEMGYSFVWHAGKLHISLHLTGRLSS